MDRDPNSKGNGGARGLHSRRPAWLSMRAAPGKTVEVPGSFAHALTHVALVMGMIAALVGAGHLAAWLGGYLTQRGLTAITMKTNAALCLTLVGVALMLLVPAKAGRVRRWAARGCAALALLVGLLVLAENLWGWDFGIDQLLAAETPGAMAVTNPNRMGVPASLSFTLIGLALLILSRRDRRGVRVVQALALAVCLIALLSTVGFLYGVQELYGIARYTAIAWPTALALLLLGLGLLCARPAEGLMAQVTADDPGGISIRRLLPAFVILLLLLGWLRLAGERAGLFDAATGTGMMMLLFIIIFSALTYHASRGASYSAQVLRESEERFRALTTASSEVLYRMSPDWSEMRQLHSRGFLANTDRPSRTWLEAYIPPDDQPHVTAAIQEAIRTKGIFELEHRVRRADGSVGWTFSRAVPLLDANGAIVEWFGSASDITERKRAEETLRESEERFRRYFELGLIGMAITSPTKGMLEVNDECCRLLGYERDELLQKTWAELTHPDDLAADVRQFDRVLAGQIDGYTIDKRFVRKNGQVVDTTISVTAMRGADGAVDYFLALLQDITERKQAEETLRKWNEALENTVAQRTAELKHRTRQLQKLTLELSQAEERERRRVAVILHEDLQQQIAGARFHLNLLRGRVRDDLQRASADRVDGMLREVIEKSRSLSGDLSPTVLHRNDLAEALGWLANRVREQHGLVVHVNVSGEMTLQSEALAIFLFRAAQEMLFNVVKHAGVRESTIRVKRIGRCVALSVVDQGRGFDPEELKETPGFGLLSIRERVDLLGGRMRIKSVKGKGSRVRIVVPDAPRAKDSPGTPKDVAVPSGVRPPSSDHALRVLLADDHEIVREGLMSLLQEAPDIVVVGEASDGREALNLANELRPDVVVMDVSMPLMSGDEATRQIKAHLPNTRVIALSVYNEAATREAMYRAGAEGYVLKTASSEELLAAIRGKESGS